MESNRLNVAVVGCGAVAMERHLPALSRLRHKGVNVAAVCDINPALAATAARAFKVANAYNNLEQMFSSEKLDVIDVCVPPAIHASVAKAAMEHGCHVLLEKPMATSVADCDLMIETSKKHNVKLGVVHNNSFHRGYMEFQNRVEKRVVGDLCGLRIYWTTPPHEMLSLQDHWAHRLPGGLIGETMPHIVYLTLPFVGAVENVSVHAWKVSNYPWVRFDNYSVFIAGDRGNASIVLSYTNNSHVVWFDALGTEGVLHLDLNSRSIFRHRCRRLSPSAVGRSILSDMAQLASSSIKGVFSKFAKSDYAGRGHDRAIISFVESIVNSTPLPVTAMDGRETVRVVDMIVKQIEGVTTPPVIAGRKARTKGMSGSSGVSCNMSRSQ